MGIKDFYKQLKTRHPECFIPVHYAQLRYQKIAIDMMNVLYVYKSRNDRDWIKLLLEFLISLRRYYVHPICVFDGQHHPLKQNTVQKRRLEREKGRNRVEKLRNSLTVYKTTGVINDHLRGFLDSHDEFVSKLSRLPLVNSIQEHIDRQYKNYNIHFRTTEIESLKELIRAMGICVLTADHDGEALCSYLTSIGEADIVLSNDSDVFFFGCKTVLVKFTNEGGYLVHLDTVLSKLELSMEQFIDLCLLCGTDFNIPIRGIGFCRAYAIVQKYISIQNTEMPLHDQLDHSLLEEIRQMAYPKTQPEQTHYSKPIQSETLQLMLFQHQIHLPLELFCWPIHIPVFEQSEVDEP